MSDGLATAHTALVLHSRLESYPMNGFQLPHGGESLCLLMKPCCHSPLLTDDIHRERENAVHDEGWNDSLCV